VAAQFIRSDLLTHLQQFPRVTDVAQPPFRIFLQAFSQPMLHLRGRSLQLRFSAFREVVALKRLLPRQHLGQHHAERPDIRALVDRFTATCSGDM